LVVAIRDDSFGPIASIPVKPSLKRKPYVIPDQGVPGRASQPTPRLPRPRACPSTSASSGQPVLARIDDYYADQHAGGKCEASSAQTPTRSIA